MTNARCQNKNSSTTLLVRKEKSIFNILVVVFNGMRYLEELNHKYIYEK